MTQEQDKPDSVTAETNATPKVGDWVFFRHNFNEDPTLSTVTQYTLHKIIDNKAFKQCVLYNGERYYTIEESNLQFSKYEKRRSIDNLHIYEVFSAWDATVVPERLDQKSTIVPASTYQLLYHYMTLVRRQCRMLLEEHVSCDDGHLSEELGLFISADEITVHDLISAGISDYDYKTLLDIARSANFIIHNPVNLEQYETERKIIELRQEADRLEKELRG